MSTINTLCGIVHLQRLRYFLGKSINTLPRKLLIMNLEQFVAESIGLGLEVILNVDTNEHMVKVKIVR